MAIEPWKRLFSCMFYCDFHGAEIESTMTNRRIMVLGQSAEAVNLNGLFVSVLTAGCVALAGCKPRTIVGQVFIVTQGRDNIKLGAVEIVLIDKQQVMDFLRQREAVIDDEINARRQELTEAQQSIETAKTKAEAAKMNYDAALAQVPKSAEYVRNQAEKDAMARTNEVIWNRIQTLQRKIEELDADWPLRASSIRRDYNPLSSGDDLTKEEIARLKADGADLRSVGPLLVQLQRILQIFRPGPEWELDGKLKAIQQSAEEKERAKVDAAQAALLNAQSRAADIQNALDIFPTTDDYVQGMMAVLSPAATIQTDADGRFSMACPRGKAFTLYATAKRAVLEKTETYFWLVDAPADTSSSQIFLSNNNLAEIDPDGYFRIKPHQKLL
jgi:hypothetical protein